MPLFAVFFLIISFLAFSINSSINCKWLLMIGHRSSLPLVSFMSAELILVFNSMAEFLFSAWPSSHLSCGYCTAVVAELN